MTENEPMKTALSKEKNNMPISFVTGLSLRYSHPVMRSDPKRYSNAEVPQRNGRKMTPVSDAANMLTNPGTRGLGA